MKRKILIVILLFLCISCNTDNNIFFMFDRADGLKEESKVLLNGSVIGQVDEISICKDYQILVKCKLNDKLDIKIITTDILGTKSIYIKSGNSTKKLSINDTITGVFEYSNLVDTIFKKSSKIINDAIDETQLKIDTLANEFKKTSKLYNISKPLIYREYNQIYKIIKTTVPSEELWNKLKNNTSPKFIMFGYLYNDKIISESALLLFLKIYHNNLKGDNYLFDISCAMNNNIYLMLFVLEYYKISKTDPVDHLVSSMVYEWIVNHPNYLKNKDIENEIEEIENLLKKKYKKSKFIKR